MSETSTPSTRRVARTRGLASGLLLVLLGAWAGLAPFIGPLFNFGFQPDKAWHWTAARGWYEVAPGAVIVVGGFLLLVGTSRLTTTLGAWLAIIAGAWLVTGPAVSGDLSLGSLTAPMGNSGGVRVAERLTFFYLLGAVVIFLASAAFGRLSVVTVRDVRVAERREAARVEAEQAAEREEAERAAREREVQQRRVAEREAYERDAAQRESADREAAYRDAVDRDAVNRDAVNRDAVNRDAAERDAADREAAERDSTQRGATVAPAGEQVDPAEQQHSQPYGQAPGSPYDRPSTQQQYPDTGDR